MAKLLRELKVLLLQLREREDVATHERDCLVKRSGLENHQVVQHNMLENPYPPTALIKNYDLIVIGGSGIYSVTKHYPFMPSLTKIIQHCHEISKPMLGICWGHQYMSIALGGESISDPERGESGAGIIKIKEGNAGNSVFKDVSSSFPSYMSHQDRISVLPPDAIELCYSDVCPNQMFQIKDKPIFGVQFHPEFSAAQFIERMEIYRHIYIPNDEEFKRMTENTVETHDADRLVKNMFDVFCESC